MKCAVTGASGHVGVNLVRALVARGHHVRALVHVETAPLRGLDAELVHGDVCDAASLRAAFDGVDVVYHLAAHIAISPGHASLLGRVNVLGTRNVVEACLDRRVHRLVHFSSIHALAEAPEGGHADESAPLVEKSSCSRYDSSKAEGERCVQDMVRSGLDAVIVAPTAVAGPYDYRPSYFGRVLLRLATGRLPVLVRGGFDWVDARDVADGAIAAAERAPAGAKYVLSGHWLTLVQVADLVSAASGAPGPLAAAPLSLARACAPAGEALARLLRREPLFTAYAISALSQHRFVSHAKASRELGYSPRPFEQTVADTIDWFRSNGYLPARKGGASQ